MTQKTYSHSFKSELKNNLSLSIPLVASSLIYASSMFVATAMVSHLGEDALAASVLVTTVWYSLIVFFFGILNSVSVLVSHQYGAKNYKNISDIMGQSFLLGMGISVLMIFILSLMPYFLKFSNQPAAVITLAYDYMRALLWTTPGLVIIVILEQFLAGINRPKLVLRISMTVVPIEIFLIYALVFGKFGLPECGIAGVGYGFATTYTCTAIFLIFYLRNSKFYRDFNLYAGITTRNFNYMKELILVGLPMGFMHVIEVSTFAITTFWIARFGTTLLAAHQIIMQYLGFFINFVFAMSQAVTVRVGHSVGRQDLDGISVAVYTGMLINVVCVALIAIAFYCIPTFFLRLDIDIHNPSNAALIRDTSTLLAICGVLLIFDNFRIIGFGALRGLKDTRFAMYASLISFWMIGLTVGYMLAFVFNFNGIGIWWGLTIGIACGAMIVFLRLQLLLKKLDVVKLAIIKG